MRVCGCFVHLAPAPRGSAQVDSLGDSFEEAELLIKLEQLEGAPCSETDLFVGVSNRDMQRATLSVHRRNPAGRTYVRATAAHEVRTLRDRRVLPRLHIARQNTRNQRNLQPAQILACVSKWAALLHHRDGPSCVQNAPHTQPCVRGCSPAS